MAKLISANSAHRVWNVAYLDLLMKVKDLTANTRNIVTSFVVISLSHVGYSCAVHYIDIDSS